MKADTAIAFEVFEFAPPFYAQESLRSSVKVFATEQHRFALRAVLVSPTRAFTEPRRHRRDRMHFAKSLTRSWVAQADVWKNAAGATRPFRSMHDAAAMSQPN